MEATHENWSCHKDFSESSWLTMEKNPKCKHDPKDRRVFPNRATRESYSRGRGKEGHTGMEGQIHLGQS